MNHGKLNTAEKARMRRMWKDLQRMISECGARPDGASHKSPIERDKAATEQSLVTARNALGVLIRWQDAEGGPLS